MTDHKLRSILKKKDGRVIALCHCGWLSLPTFDPLRSIYGHRRKMLGF